MAEFQAVMRQYKRMYEAHGKNNDFFSRWRFLFEPETIERCVMEWAAANPELRYPTWREWHSTKPNNERLCPMALCNFVPCPHGTEVPEFSVCSACHDIPIPADIAKKLRVGPISEDKP